jgi:hypothetical protein
MVSLRDWFFGREGIYRQQLDALKAECADLKPPKVIYALPVQKELRHAPPTICGKCRQPTGYNDGVQPCNTCFLVGLETAQDAIARAAHDSKVAHIQTWRTK